jgi:hypothetical protein
MRYYFHLRIGGTIDPDEIGVELANIETAYLEAFKAAQEMWSELLAQGSDPLTRCFEIGDERGQLLLSVPFVEVLEQARKSRPPLPKLRQSLQAELQKHRELMTSLSEQVRRAHDQIKATRDALDSAREMLTREP